MKVIVCAVIGLISSTASSAVITVTEAWQAARTHDPAFRVAQAQWEAGRSHGSMGTALWLPTLTATGGVGRSDLQSRTRGAYFSAPGFGSTNGVDFQTDVKRGTARRWSIIAEQPLFDAGRLADSTSHKNVARMAAAQYRQAEQDLMVRSTRAYFEVLNARAVRGTLQRLRAAAVRASAEAQARYDAGDIPATDMREAQASADAIGVQELDVQTTVALAEAAFTDLTGLDVAAISELPEAATEELPVAESLDVWTQRALDNSPLLTQRVLALRTARAQVSRFNALTVPRISLLAQLGRDSLAGNGDFGATDIATRQGSIFVQASLPLFTGGMRTAQRHEAQALAHLAEAELDGANQQVRQQTRVAWLTLTSAAARVQALQRLRLSTAGRLAATRLGNEIGSRSAIELLHAEADFQRSGSDFQRAQADWLLGTLQLKAVAGELRESDLVQIDRRLGKDPG
jgi:outer membrane protein